MKILNLYAGIGGNRKLWNGPNLEIVAIEHNERIAGIYKDLYPSDEVIVSDAHQYLLDHYKEFDFIWSSPPCQSHSITNHFLNAQGIVRYPQMQLYQEILFLTHFCKCKFVVENVKPYYEPLIKAKEIGRHLFWSNFIISKIDQPKKDIGRMNGNRQLAHSKTQEERNMVNPDLGMHVLNCAMDIITKQNVEQTDLFL